ncbi:hypothetical protein RFI_03866 [Reticulomyxa filosa]|uniref:SecA DEAD-like N-terminal domain-containing protein n=1 Tax=Reticulomyxa filosa TaxID=46433 RepID=X6P4W8_RETFI|nr:hypothetical protein RFI_03866 [Reticulomyxa filosa]|eukprot:ETO33241.1 hypothetical protein RFI_03866 [Reticulomyxa filosa]
MEELRGMKVVKERTGSQYYQTIEKINAFVREIQKDIDAILGSLNRQNVSIDYNRLCECVRCVSNSKWIDERQEDGSSSLMETIKQKLISHLHELQQLSQELELDLDHPEHFKDARNVFAHLGNLRRLEVTIPELTPFRQKAGGPLEQSVRAILATIRREFALEAKNVANQEKMKESLIQLRFCAEDIRAANSYLQEMKFENAKDLDSKINVTKIKIEELIKIMTMPDQKYKDNTKAIQEKLSQLEETKQEHENENSIPNSLPTSPQLTSDKEAAIHYLKTTSKQPMEGVEEGKQNLEKLKQEEKGMNESYQKQMKELKEKLDKDEQVKREYEKQLQKGEMSLASVCKSLKSHEFVESDVQSLIDNKKELNDKIRQCKREIAKLKKNSGYTFEVLSASKTAKVLQYLKECKAIGFPVDTITSQFSTSGNDEDEKKQTEHRPVVPLREEITNTLNLVKEFLRKYSIFVQNQLNSLNLTESGVTPNNDEKKDNNNDGDISTIEEVEGISDRLTEVKKLQKDYPTIFTYFPQDIIEQFDKRLKRMYLDLSDEMTKLAIMEASSALLKRKVTIAKALSELDDFAQPNHKFRDLFLMYQNKIHHDETEIKPVLEAIRNRRYSIVAMKMHELEKTDDPNKKKSFNEIKTSLSEALYTLAKKIKVLPLEESEADIKNLNELKNSLEYIKKAQSAIQFVNEVAKKEIVATMKKVKSDIKKNMETELDAFDRLLTNLKFLDAKKKSERTKKEGKNGRKSEIMNRVNQLKNAIENKLKETVDRFKNGSLPKFTSSPTPNEIYANFITAKYEVEWKEIEDIILKKVRAQLKTACRDTEKESSMQIQHVINQCKTVVAVLPDHMKEMLDKDMKQGETEIKDNMDKAMRNADKALNTKNVDHINHFLDECTSIENEEIERQAPIMIRKMVEVINQKWANEDVTGVLKDLKDLLNIKSAKLNLSAANNSFESTRNAFTDQFGKIRQKTTTSLDALDRCEVSPKTMESIEKLLEFFIQCMNFKADVKNKANEVMPFDFDQKIKELDRRISNSFSSLEKKFKINIEKKNVPELLKVLDIMKIVGNDNFLQKLKTFKQKKMDCGIPEDPNTSTNLWTYSEIMNALNSHLEKMSNDMINEGVINDTTTKANDAKLNQYFQNMKDTLDFIPQMSQCKTHVTNIEKLEPRLKQLEQSTQQIVNTMETSKWSPSDCNCFNHWHKCFIFMQKYSILSNFAKSQITIIDSMVNKQVSQLEKDAIDDLRPENLVNCLVKVKIISVNMFDFKDNINKRIDELLNTFKKKNSSGLNIATLALEFEKESTGVGKMIVAEHSVFKGYSIALFNQKIKAHGIDHVLDKMRVKGDPIDKSKLKKMYEDFYAKYNQLVHDNLLKVKEDPKQLDVFANNARLCARGIKQIPEDENWDASIRNSIPEMMANIFALWTLQQVQYYHDAKGVDNQKSYLVQPHPAQVISIFRILGVEEKKKGLTNHLIQIGTGEGKSVTLAITCCVLALFGFDVSCASYSEYLSSRDFKSFEQLFNILGVINHIHYGTFGKICERIINEGGDVRKLVENLILPGNDNEEKKSNEVVRSKILLVDEVDVFFNKDFYGKCYSPAATLRHDTITKLVDFIWKKRGSFLKLKDVKQSNEYKACCNVLKGWDSLLDEAIKDMLNDVQNFLSHGYQVSNDKIGYKEQDDISYNIRYGYKTLFAYYHEHEQNKISNSSFKNNIHLTLRIVNFSYVAVPEHFYRIMGVSGTLETLSSSEQEAVEKEYHISKHTYMPSLFSKNQLAFAEKVDIFIVDESDYFITLKKEINDRLVGKMSGTKRAVLVFFETKKQLMEFYGSPNFAEIKNDAIVMTEENSFEEKEFLIKRAASSGQVGLFTKIFGRGTDFICCDEIVSSNGGPHVIQAFLSEELSEEVQIKGRTARQGGSGSYSLVLCDKSLEKFLITRDDIQRAREARDFYSMLDKKRNEFFKTQYTENKKYVEYATKQHKLSAKLIASVKRKEVNTVKKMLYEQNKGAEERKSSYTVVLMDATGSMQHLLQKTKNTVCTMFDRISIILKDNGLPPNCFEMQFVVYRNYNAPEDMILQASPWESKPDNLREFMETIRAGYGLGNEAIEIGLAYVNTQVKKMEVSQVILIGDMPPNTRQEVARKRQIKGEYYWKGTNFSIPTYYEKELDLLEQCNIPVHAFYVNEQAKEHFEAIARTSGGKCAELQINSDEGSEQLTGVVSTTILKHAGGSRGDELVEAYRIKFAPNLYI